ncbi:hypothetical protein Hanom_Chr06g00540741 [Helianthus anomalus]
MPGSFTIWMNIVKDLNTGLNTYPVIILSYSSLYIYQNNGSHCSQLVIQHQNSFSYTTNQSTENHYNHTYQHTSMLLSFSHLLPSLPV